MKVDGALFGNLTSSQGWSVIPERIGALEELGYDGCMAAETGHDPFLQLMLAAEHSERIELMTSIAVAFGRSPLTLAHSAHDLNAYSKGRFILGLGSQIKAHITKRYSMPWSRPAARMREFILAMRAIWDSWYKGEKLDFRGEFYTHTLMTPFFSPTPTEYGPPRIHLAAVGPLMTEVAAEVADGIVCHPFSSERYLRHVTLPAIERGLEKAGKQRRDFEITCSRFVVTGSDERAWAESRASVAEQIAFYASTPAYRGVLETHDWGELQNQLNAMSKQGQWKQMGELISDEIVDAFAVSAEPQHIASGIQERFGGLLDRVSLYFPLPTLEHERHVIEELRKN